MTTTKIERAWKGVGGKSLDPWKEIDEDTAARQLANQYGDNALKTLWEEKELETRFGIFRVVSE